MATETIELCAMNDEDGEELFDDDPVSCERPRGHGGAHMVETDRGGRVYWTTDGSDVITGESPSSVPANNERK